MSNALCENVREQQYTSSEKEVKSRRVSYVESITAVRLTTVDNHESRDALYQAEESNNQSSTADTICPISSMHQNKSKSKHKSDAFKCRVGISDSLFPDDASCRRVDQ
jgi:hypothetical protein